MKYYLDSSSLITGVRKLPELKGKYDVLTSALSIIERVSSAGKDDASYGRAKSVIKALSESKYTVDWNMPDYYLHSGFNYLRDNCYGIVEYRIKDLEAILKCLLDSKDRESFLVEEQSLNLKYPLEYFSHYDSSFGPSDQARMKEQIDIVKEAFKQAEAGTHNTLVPKEIIAQGFKKFAEWFAEQNGVLNNSLTVWSLAQRTANSLGKNPLTDEVVGEVYKTYNGLIDVFVSAYSIASIKNIGSQNMPGRNDQIDFAHLLYIAKDAALVTEDKKMRVTAEEAGVKVFSIAEL